MSAEHAPITPIKGPRTSEQILEALVGRRATLRADQEFITGELESIDAQLIELLGTVGVHDVAGTKVEVREYSRTDLAWVEAEYPAAQYPQLYKTSVAVDGAAVKKQFAPAVLEQHKVRGAKSVVIR